MREPPFSAVPLVAKYTPSAAERRAISRRRAIEQAQQRYDETWEAVRAPKREPESPAKRPGSPIEAGPSTPSSLGRPPGFPDSYFRELHEARQRQQTGDPSSRLLADQERLRQAILNRLAAQESGDYYSRAMSPVQRGDLSDPLPATVACEKCKTLRPAGRVEDGIPCPGCDFIPGFVKVELPADYDGPYDERYAKRAEEVEAARRRQRDEDLQREYAARAAVLRQERAEADRAAHRRELKAARQRRYRARQRRKGREGSNPCDG